MLTHHVRISMLTHHARISYNHHPPSRDTVVELLTAVVTKSPIDNVRIGAVSVDGDVVTTLFTLGEYRCAQQMVDRVNEAFDASRGLNYSSNLGSSHILSVLYAQMFAEFQSCFLS